MALWKEILLIVISPITIVGVVVYFGRKIFERTLERDLEKYKNELELRSIEYQTKLSYIHEKRAEVLGEFYGLLQDGHGKLTRLVGVIQFEQSDLKAKKEMTSHTLYEMQNYYFNHKLYFEKQLQGKIENILDEIWGVFVKFDLIQDGDTYKPDPTGMWMATYEKTTKELPPLLEEIENKFQSIIGLEIE